MTFQDIIEALSAMLTPIIALIAIYIAWQQHKTNSDRLRLDLYEKRFRIYRAVMDLLTIIQRDGAVSREDIAKYQSVTNEHSFLFDKDVNDLVLHIRKKASELRSLPEKCELASTDEKLNRLSEKDIELLEWFDEQPKEVVSKFRKYLRFNTNC